MSPFDYYDDAQLAVNRTALGAASPASAAGYLARWGAMSSRADAHYANLFRDLEVAEGPLDPDTLTSIVGFSAGAPVSLQHRSRDRLFITCELSLYDEQRVRSEGLRFDLLLRNARDEDSSRELLTALGSLSMQAQLGDGHTIDVTQGVSSGIYSAVRLQLYSKCRIGLRRYGIYEVIAA